MRRLASKLLATLSTSNQKNATATSVPPKLLLIGTQFFAKLEKYAIALRKSRVVTS
uniref:Uncharacterized protein n=1 Tax=Arundo donax TaxID=35708 RepID=A0A0A8YDP8_ARUDO